jgi:secretion/DNA translocation related TadE-like protein
VSSSSGALSLPPNRVSDDRGAATVLAAILISAIATVTVGGIALGSVVVARHRAQAAADLAALAAASRVPAGSQAACLQAQAVTAAMGTTLRSCELLGLDVTVSVAAGTGLRMGGDARATARAGPIDRG